MKEFQYFKNGIKGSKPLGLVTLDYFLNSIKNPNEITKRIFITIQTADPKERGKLKQSELYYFTPCVLLDGGRKYADIIQFNGLLVLDFDKIDDAIGFRDHLFIQHEYIIAAWISPSGRGVKALVSIPVVKTTEEFKELHYGITNVMKHYNGWDDTSKNCVLPLFQCWDSSLLYRAEPAVWTIKAKDPKQHQYKVEKPIVPVNIKSTDGLTVVKILKTMIGNINGDGHPQVRRAGLIAGGYVASGYIGQAEAEDLLAMLIRGNSYLQKNIKGYIKTAKHFISEGMKSQLTLD